MFNGFINPPALHRGVSRVGATVKEIFTLDDFQPSGGIITLDAGHYQIKDTIDIGTNRFVFASGSPFVLMQFDDSFNNWIEHSGDDMTLFSGDGALRLLHGKGNAFVILGDNVKFIDVLGSFGALYTFIGFYGSGGSLGDIRGRIVNQSATAGLILRECILDGWEDGFTVTNAVETLLSDVGGAASASATGTLYTLRGTGDLAIINESQFNIPSGASLLDIDPTITIPISINGYHLHGGAAFFKPGTKSGSFTAVADASIGATSITGVSDSGGIPRFAFTGPTVYVGQEVVISGFVTNTDYNNTWFISATDGTSYFEVDSINFGSTETGSFLSHSVTLTETSTTAADGDSILLDTDGSTAYDTGSYVYNKQTNSFQVNAEWSATATGDWANGSQDSKSKYVHIKDCGEQTDSRHMAAVYTTGNTDTTTATADTWVDLDLGTATGSPSASRFKLVDSEAGEIEYTGLDPYEGFLTAHISAFKAGGTVILHQFRAYKSSGSPAFETVIAERDLDVSLGSLTLGTPIAVEPGDRFKIQIKAITTTTTVTIQNISIAVHD